MTAAAILNFGETTFLVTRSISWLYIVNLMYYFSEIRPSYAKL